jgi:hypothetical protein
MATASPASSPTWQRQAPPPQAARREGCARTVHNLWILRAAAYEGGRAPVVGPRGTWAGRDQGDVPEPPHLSAPDGRVSASRQGGSSFPGTPAAPGHRQGRTAHAARASGHQAAETPADQLRARTYATSRSRRAQWVAPNVAPERRPTPAARESRTIASCGQAPVFQVRAGHAGVRVVLRCPARARSSPLCGALGVGDGCGRRRRCRGVFRS